jgi:hypothetical protein
MTYMVLDKFKSSNSRNEFTDRATLHQCLYPAHSDDMALFINKWEIMLTRLTKLPDDNELHWVFWEQASQVL